MTKFTPERLAPLAAPILTGDARAVTPLPGDADTSIATSGFVAASISAAIGGASGGQAQGFRATKTGGSQSGILSATITKVTFPNEVYDRGNYYDTTLSRWTPPAGLVHIDASFYVSAGITVNTTTYIYVYKNDVILERALLIPQTANTGIQISVDDVASGTDYYEIYFFGTSAATLTIAGGGTPDTAFFSGHVVSPKGPIGLPGASANAPSFLSGQLQWVSTTSLRFIPHLGDRILIGGAYYSIPPGGVAGLGNTSVFINGTSGNLAANTTYFIYAFDSSSIVTADYSTTGHATSSTAGNVGNETKSGDDSRTLIGICRTNASSQFADNDKQRFVRSWFNRQPIAGGSTLTAASANVPGATQSPIFQELSSADLRLELLVWAGELVKAHFTGNAAAASAGYTPYSTIGFDGVTPERGATAAVSSNADYNYPVSAVSIKSGLSEGYHYLTALGTTNGGSCNWYGTAYAGGAKAAPCAIQYSIETEGSGGAARDLGLQSILNTFTSCRMDPYRLIPQFDLSNNNLTVTRNIVNDAAWYTMTSEPYNGLWPWVYFEATVDALGVGGDMFVGFCIGIFNPQYGYNTYYLGQDGNGYSWGYYRPGGWYFGSAYTNGYLPAFTDGHVLAFALDIDTGYLWARNITLNTNWNGTYYGAGADPSTGVGKLDYSSYFRAYQAQLMRAAVSATKVGGKVTFNFDGPMLGPVPARYRSWRGRMIP